MSATHTDDFDSEGTSTQVECYSQCVLHSANNSLLLSLIRDSSNPCITIVPWAGNAGRGTGCTLPQNLPLDMREPSDPPFDRKEQKVRVMIAYANQAALRVLGYGFQELKMMDAKLLETLIAGRDTKDMEKRAMIDWISDRIANPDLIDRERGAEEKVIYYQCQNGTLLPSNTDVHLIRYQSPTSTAPTIPGLLLWIHPVYPINKSHSLRSQPSSGASMSSLAHDATSADFEARLQKVYMGACAAIGHDFFKKVLESICNWAGFYYSWISVVIPRQEVPSKEKDLQKDVKLRILGFWHKDNGYMPDSRGVEYNASDSPCSLTLTDNVVAIPENVQKLFPDNPFWKVLNPLPTSYIAMAVLDTESGDYLGNVGMMDTQAGLEGLVGSPEHVKIGLRVFAERVGAELKRMRMEEAIRYAREDAVKANESKSQYMNHLNHELRTPMNAVIGMAELLDDTSLNESQRELVTTLRSSGAHLLSVINNVLDLTKIELGSVTLCNEPLEVAMILDEVVKMIRPSDVGISAMQRGAGSRSTSPAVTNPRVKPEPDSSPAARGRTSHSQDSARTLSPAREPGFADYKLIERQKSDGSQNLSSRAEPDCQTDACGRSDSCGPSRKRVEIKWEVGHDVPKFIEGDRGRLRQILINLLANAYKFTDTGHVIARCCLSDAADHAEAKQVNGTSMNDPPAAANPATTDAPHQMSNGPDESQTATKPREEIVLQFEVQDTGPGVPAEKAEDLFKPFVQLDTTRGQHSQGSGLGLTIAQHLVHLMGGRIWLKVPPPGSPSPTIGTTIAFTIRTHIVPIPELIHSEFTSLPRSMRLSSSSRASNSETSSSNGQKSWDRTLAERLPLKILLAEDDMLNARIAKSMFGKFGYTAVTHAVNGVEVLEAVRKAAEEGWMFDVLFCDIFMPEMDGYTTATKVKEFLVAHPEIKTAPRIIALTANASVEDRNKCLDLGMCAYMTKPLTIQELYESLVETGRVRSES